MKYFTVTDLSVDITSRNTCLCAGASPELEAESGAIVSLRHRIVILTDRVAIDASVRHRAVVTPVVASPAPDHGLSRRPGWQTRLGGIALCMLLLSYAFASASYTLNSEDVCSSHRTLMALCPMKALFIRG